MKFSVERSIEIKSDGKKVMGLVSNFKHWSSWSPWTIVEPGCRIEVEGKSGSVGHEMSWDGEIIGSGKNTLVGVSEDRLEYDLEFLKPWKSSSKVNFRFESVSGGTKVSWAMDGNMPFFMFFMIPMMKGWIGMDYDRGLKMLKAMAEEGKVKAKTTNKGVVDVEGFSYVGLKRTVDVDKVGEVMKKDFERLKEDVVKTHGKSSKHCLSVYPKMDMKNMRMTYIAAVSDEELGDVDLGGDYVSGSVKSGKALEVAHDGVYDFLGNAWSMGMMYVRAKKMKQSGVPFELYWNDPEKVKPEKLKTSVFFPVK